MIKFLSRSLFVAMTGTLMPVAFTYAYVGICEWADKTWLDD